MRIAVGRACLVMLAAFAAVSPATVGAANADDGLVVVDPLPGYEQAKGGLMDGAIDGGTLMELTGTDPDDVPDEVREFAGEARTWRNDAGAIAIAYVIDCDDVQSARDFLHGALEGSRESSDSTFESGLSGTAGFVVEATTGSVHSVIWRQDKYFVEVVVVGVSNDASAIDTKTLAGRQIVFLRSAVDAEPTLNTSRPSEGDGSVGFMVGRVIGTLMFGGIIAAVIWSSNRRKAEQRAHEARFAIPPPPFIPSQPQRATLPPPSLPAPHAPSMSDH